METRKYGNTGMNVSTLGFGGAEIGKNVSKTDVATLLNSALDAGLNVIDTAECYGDSEELIGEDVCTFGVMTTICSPNVDMLPGSKVRIGMPKYWSKRLTAV